MSTRYGRAAALLVLVAAVGAAGCSPAQRSSRSGGPTTTSVLRGSEPSTTSSTTQSPPTTIANSWRAYWTSVNPGSAIDFVSAQVGWRLDGQIWGPGLDNNLGSGVVDNGAAWPGTSIAETTDGGRTWTTILGIGSGIWGMDLVSRDVGFAVGVTSLRRTIDAGAHWQQVPEPAGHHLVWVHFATNEVGYGLTTTGSLVRTLDGGSSWIRAGMTRTGTAACFTSARVGYVTDSSGDVYATRDAGRSWTEVERGPARIQQFIGPWSSLSCDGRSIWLGLQLICGAACLAASPYAVTDSSDGGLSWSAMASEWQSASGATAPVAYLATVAALSDHGVIVDLPNQNVSPLPKPQFRVLVARAANSGYVIAGVPSLPAPSSRDLDAYVHVRGVSFLGSTGWLYFDDTGVGTAAQPRAEPVLWKTTNGGSSWQLVDEGPSQPPPSLG